MSESQDLKAPLKDIWYFAAVGSRLVSHLTYTV